MGDMTMPGVPRNIGDGGWSNGASFGNPKSPLTRVVVHWFNLPNWHGPLGLVAKTTSGEREWSGRWVHQASGWKITLDVRPDYQEIWRDLHTTTVYVVTHVMEVRRADGSPFTADEVEPAPTAMHVGISFALSPGSSWVRPAWDTSCGSASVHDTAPLAMAEPSATDSSSRTTRRPLSTTNARPDRPTRNQPLRDGNHAGKRLAPKRPACRTARRASQQTALVRAPSRPPVGHRPTRRSLSGRRHQQSAAPADRSYGPGRVLQEPGQG
jgi:hypothetical protein